MDTSDKIAYQSITTQYHLPLLCQPWWWDAVCTGKDWHLLTVYDTQGKLVGTMPYHVLRKFGISVIVMPPRTQKTYIWIHPEADSTKVLIELEHQLKLAQHHFHALFIYLQLSLSPAQINFFQNKGYSVKERTTYCIALTKDLDCLSLRFSKNKRRQIKRASKICHLIEMSADNFYQFHVDTLRQRGRVIEYSYEVWQALFQATTARSQGRIIAAADEQNNTLAALFLTWDSKRCYALLPVYSPAYKETGAMAWLTNESIRFASTVSEIYDFEGSMNPGIANSYRQYASTPDTYYSVSNREWISHIVNAIIKLLKFIR